MARNTTRSRPQRHIQDQLYTPQQALDIQLLTVQTANMVQEARSPTTIKQYKYRQELFKEWCRTKQFPDEFR